MKEQQAQAKRSHQRKEEEATRNRFMGGFCEENTNETRRRQGKKTQAPTPKEQKATRNETKMKNHKRKQKRNHKTQEEEAREIALGGFCEESKKKERLIVVDKKDIYAPVEAHM